MKLYAHETVEYRVQFGRTARIPAGTWKEVSDGVGQKLLMQHAQDLCDVGDVTDPATHQCLRNRRSGYAHEAMTTPPATTHIDGPRLTQREIFQRASPQKRQMIRKKLKGSLRFRREFYNAPRA